MLENLTSETLLAGRYETSAVDGLMRSVDAKTMFDGSTDIVESKIGGVRLFTEPYG